MRSEKSIKDNTLRVRLNSHEAAKLKFYAESHARTVSQVIREYIRRLPNPKFSPGEDEA